MTNFIVDGKEISLTDNEVFILANCSNISGKDPLDAIQNNNYQNYIESTSCIARMMKLKVNQVKGVLSSMVKKNLIDDLEESESGYLAYDGIAICFQIQGK